MNICIESHVLNHYRRSGLMTYTEGLVYGMHKFDHMNKYSLVYYSLHRKAHEMPGPTGNNFHKAVLRVPDREFKGRQRIVDQLVLPLFFKKNKIRIFHRTSGYTMPSSKNVFQILTVHDLRTLTIGDSTWAQNISRYKKTIEALDLCVTVSECTKKDLVERLGIKENKIKVIYLGADERFKPAPKEDIENIRRKYQLNEPFLLSMGSVPRKNIDGIIRGFALSQSRKNTLLVLSCNSHIEKHKELAQSLGVGERIRILDKLIDSEIVPLYSGSSAFVFPSLYEGFGLPILEAFQCQTPVITSNLSSCPEVAGDAALLVDPHKPEEIGGAIDQIHQNSHLRQTLIEKGIERSKLFNWNKYAQETKKIYDNV
jgi:glycosyltransferase involved in cell wall biosynthesis